MVGCVVIRGPMVDGRGGWVLYNRSELHSEIQHQTTAQPLCSIYTVINSSQRSHDSKPRMSHITKTTVPLPIQSIINHNAPSPQPGVAGAGHCHLQTQVQVWSPSLPLDLNPTV
jgi:hypothetical protein